MSRIVSFSKRKRRAHSPISASSTVWSFRYFFQQLRRSSYVDGGILTDGKRRSEGNSDNWLSSLNDRKTVAGIPGAGHDCAGCLSDFAGKRSSLLKKR